MHSLSFATARLPHGKPCQRLAHYYIILLHYIFTKSRSILSTTFSKPFLFSYGNTIMPRKPSGRIDVCLRINAELYQRLKEIAKSQGCSIADLVEPKLIELVALYDAGIGIRRGWDLNPRTLTGRGSRVPRSAELCNPGLEYC